MLKRFKKLLIKSISFGLSLLGQQLKTHVHKQWQSSVSMCTTLCGYVVYDVSMCTTLCGYVVYDVLIGKLSCWKEELWIMSILWSVYVSVSQTLPYMSYMIGVCECVADTTLYELYDRCMWVCRRHCPIWASYDRCMWVCRRHCPIWAIWSVYVSVSQTLPYMIGVCECVADTALYELYDRCMWVCRRHCPIWAICVVNWAVMELEL